MATSRMLSDVQPELQAPKSAWHTLLSKHHDAFANLVWYLVADEALVESVMLRALTRLEIMPFDSSDASLTYNQAHSVMIGEAIAQLKETPDPRAPVSVGDLLDLQRLSLSAKHVRRRHARRSLPERLDRDDILSLPTKFKLSTEVGGIRIPDTPLASATTKFVRAITPLWLMHHLLRSYAFADLLGRNGRMMYDHELLYLAAIMHDLGLIDEFAGSQPYELDGADAAKQFLLEQGVQETRIDIVWNAISSHTSRGEGERTEPEIALLGFGVLADITGARIEQIPARKVKEVLEAWPRHGFGEAFPRLVAKIVRRKPQTAIERFAADVFHQRGIAVPTVCELDLASCAIR